MIFFDLKKCGSQSVCLLRVVVVVTVLVALAFPVMNGVLVYPAFVGILTDGVEKDTERITRHISPLLISNQAYEGYTSLGLRELQTIESLERDFQLAKIRFMNDRGVILYSSDGTEFGGRYDPERFQMLSQQVNPVSELSTIDCLYPQEKGCKADVVISAVPINLDGRFVGVLETFSDVTSRKMRMDSILLWSTVAMSILSISLVTVVVILLRKQAEHVKLLETTQELRDDVERIVQHDLRSPLTNILSGSNYLQLVVSDKEQIEIVEQMQVAGWRMMQMINRSLDLYKMECGTYEFIPESVNMLQVMRDVQTELVDLSLSRRVGVELTHAGKALGVDDRHSVPAEKMLSHTLLANLLKNALEAAPRESSVQVDLRREADEHVLSVTNVGTVPEEIRPTFFEKYVTSGKRSGTGLGTYSARLITETQGGAIELSCTDQMVTIFVRFPVHQEFSMPLS